MTGETPTSAMHFCGEPTADFDEAGNHLRTWYDANCPELHLGGWRAALRRGIRRVLFGYRDYDVDRDRHWLMLGLINEVRRIETERLRQVGGDPLAILRAKADDQMAYWRKRMAAEKSRGDGIGEDGLTYTPIGDDAAWQGGYCNGRLGEAEWWQSTLKYMTPAPGIEIPKGPGSESPAEGESPVRSAEAP